MGIGVKQEGFVMGNKDGLFVLLRSKCQSQS